MFFRTNRPGSRKRTGSAFHEVMSQGTRRGKKIWRWKNTEKRERKKAQKEGKKERGSESPRRVGPDGMGPHRERLWNLGRRKEGSGARKRRRGYNQGGPRDSEHYVRVGNGREG